MTALTLVLLLIIGIVFIGGLVAYILTGGNTDAMPKVAAWVILAATFIVYLWDSNSGYSWNISVHSVLQFIGLGWT